MANVPYFYPGQDALIYHTQLNQSLQDGISNNGYEIPNQSTANISDLSAIKPNGTMWYDKDTNELKVSINGVVKVIQVM
jgi:hypothetical protein